MVVLSKRNVTFAQYTDTHALNVQYFCTILLYNTILLPSNHCLTGLLLQGRLDEKMYLMIRQHLNTKYNEIPLQSYNNLLKNM